MNPVPFHFRGVRADAPGGARTPARPRTVAVTPIVVLQGLLLDDDGRGGGRRSQGAAGTSRNLRTGRLLLPSRSVSVSWEQNGAGRKRSSLARSKNPRSHPPASPSAHLSTSTHPTVITVLVNGERG